MRKIVVAGLVVLMVLFITACGSKEEDEVLDFHNDMINTLQPIYVSVGDLGEEIMVMTDDEEVYEKLEEELIPKAEETEAFFAEQEPETEPTIEYYNLRKDANDDFVSYTYESRDITKQFLDGDISYEEFDIKIMEAMEYMEQFGVKSQQAEERWEEIYDEYGFKEVEK